MNTKSKLIAAVVAAGAALAMTGCTSNDPVPTGETFSSSSSSSSATPGPSSESLIARAKWGEVVDFGSTSLAVGAPEAFVPSSSAVSMEPVKSKATRFSITLKNNGETAVNPYSFSTSATLPTSALSHLVDYKSNVEGAPAASVLPGRSVTWYEGFNADPSSEGFAVEASPSFGPRSAFWNTTGESF